MLVHKRMELESLARTFNALGMPYGVPYLHILQRRASILSLKHVLSRLFGGSRLAEGGSYPEGWAHNLG